MLDTGTVNKVVLVGYLMKDPEFVEMPEGKLKATLTIATKRQWLNENNEVKAFIDWHRVIVYGALAKSLETRAKKRNLVYVEGRTQNRMWKDDKGEARFVNEIIIDTNGRYQTLRVVRETKELNIDKSTDVSLLNEEQREALLIDEIESMLSGGDQISPTEIAVL